MNTNEFCLLTEESNLCAWEEAYLKKVFGKDVNSENITRRTCKVSFKRDPNSKDFEVVFSRVTAFRVLSKQGAYSAYLDLANGFKIQLFVAPLSGIPDNWLFDSSEFMEACIAESSGWVLCAIKEGVEFKKKKKLSNFLKVEIPVPHNAKLKIL